MEILQESLGAGQAGTFDFHKLAQTSNHYLGPVDSILRLRHCRIIAFGQLPRFGV